MSQQHNINVTNKQQGQQSQQSQQGQQSRLGQFNLILGPMFGSKTSELIRQYNRYTIGGKKCIMVKYAHDTRYHKEKIVTHDNIMVDALVCEYLYQIDDQINSYDVILVDEIQFYKDAHIYCDKWAISGHIVEACGLNGTFERKQFPIISKLIPQVENITHLKAVCRDTGADAVFSKLITNESKELANVDGELIGGNDLFVAVDRETFFNKFDEIIRDQNIKLYELACVYCEINDIQMDDHLITYLKLHIDVIQDIIPHYYNFIEVLISAYSR